MSGDELTPPDDGQPFDPYYTDVEPSAAAGGVWANRRVRNGLIAAGVVAAAVVIIGINDGNSGGAGSALRSQDQSAATTTTIRDTDDEDDDAVATVTRSLDDVTTPGGPVVYDEFSADEFTDDEFFDDDDFTDDTLFDDGFFDDDEFADDEFFDDFFSDDDDFFSDDDFFRPSTGNRNRLAPRVPFVPRTTTTVAATTTTEAPEETTTTVADTTTTVADTTTTTVADTTTTPTTLPAPTWTPVTQGLTCSNPLTLWVRGSTLLAGSQDDELFALSGDQWSAATGTVAGRVRAVVADPGDPTARWVAGSNGVFRLAGTAAPVEIGDLSDVVSLSASPDGQTLLAATTTALHRWTGLGPWNPVTPPLATGETIQAVHVHDGTTDTAFLGTSLGVRESDDGGLTWEPVPNLPSGVVGDPVFANGVLSWLRTGGQGVLQWTADPAGWTFDDDAGNAIPDTTASLAVLADGRLLTVGTGKLVASTDGAAWTDFGPALPANYPTAGVVRNGTATFVWASDCRTDVVLRLTDPAA